MTPDDVIPLHLADVTYPPSHPLAGQNGPVSLLCTVAHCRRISANLFLVGAEFACVINPNEPAACDDAMDHPFVFGRWPASHTASTPINSVPDVVINVGALLEVEK